ncbi:hypothetical protein GCM10010404_84030 [Nonomuraea africana]|uniref:Transposase n=1 Tax=Nonomuraea africana TaxID=46171 RepID=A0ABR9KJ74_9ACTN|nr:hypothetical protein [Nonomuraea africana]
MRELRRANEILKSAAALCARESAPDRPTIAFIDAHRDRCGVEPIYQVLEVAPSAC